MQDVAWRRLHSFEDRLVFQTHEWLRFVSRAQAARPVVAAVQDGRETVGYFTGLTVRRFGIPILGSPMPGWSTSYMGFNLEDGVPRRSAVEALLTFAFETLGCLHLEFRDRYLTTTDVEGLGLEHTPWPTYEVDLTPTEETLWASMDGDVRSNVRRSARLGVVIEEASDLGFADDFYAQLEDVFAKQSLTPTYRIDRVRHLIEDVHPSGRLLLLRARNEDGQCIATGIFPALKKTMYFWGGASWREFQILRPNEPIVWYAMRYWKERGAERADLGGGLVYKRKYRPEEVDVPFFRKSRYRGLASMRNLAKEAVAVQQRVRWQAGRARTAAERS
jgi:hypothetical protein